MKKISVLLVFLLICSFCAVPSQAWAVYSEIVTSSKAEYDQFVAENELPTYFIHYEDLSFLGEFSSFEWWADRLDYIQYRLASSLGKRLCIFRISYEGEGLEMMKESDARNPDGKRTVPVPEKDLQYNASAVGIGPAVNDYGLCRIGKFLLRYSPLDGDLSSIIWYNDEQMLRYSLSPSSSAAEESEFFAKLLDAETFEETSKLLYDVTVLGQKFDSVLTTDNNANSKPVTDDGAVTDVPMDEGMVDVSTETAPLTDVAPTDGTTSGTPLTDGTDGETTDTPTAPAPFPWVWVIVPAGIVLIAAATAALVIRKKKKQ